MIEYNKGIWKTGALAVAVTLVFALFVFKFEDWTRDFNSAFVHAQSTGGGGGTGSSGTSVTKVIPQVAVGSYDGGPTKYITVIEIVNTGTAAIGVSGNFYNTDGSASTLALKSNLIPA